MPAIMTPSLIDELEDALASKTGGTAHGGAVAHHRPVHRGRDTYSEDHVTLFDDVIQRLAATIEKNARAKLSSRLRAPAQCAARRDPSTRLRPRRSAWRTGAAPFAAARRRLPGGDRRDAQPAAPACDRATARR
jgi:hypothetical protein